MSDTTEVAKAGWFLLGVGWTLLLMVIRHELPEIVKIFTGDTFQITERTKPSEAGTPEGCGKIRYYPASILPRGGIGHKEEKR